MVQPKRLRRPPRFATLPVAGSDGCPNRMQLVTKAPGFFGNRLSIRALIPARGQQGLPVFMLRGLPGAGRLVEIPGRFSSSSLLLLRVGAPRNIFVCKLRRSARRASVGRPARSSGRPDSTSLHRRRNLLGRSPVAYAQFLLPGPDSVGTPLRRRIQCRVLRAAPAAPRDRHRRPRPAPPPRRRFHPPLFRWRLTCSFPLLSLRPHPLPRAATCCPRSAACCLWC